MPYRKIAKNVSDELNFRLLISKLLCTINGCQYDIIVPYEQLKNFLLKKHKILFISFLNASKIECKMCGKLIKTYDKSFYESSLKLTKQEKNKIYKIGIKQYEYYFTRNHK